MSISPVRILLVEGDPGAARLVREQLGEAGTFPCRVVRACRLADACEHLAREAPDVVLLALDLPDSSGLDTLRAVRACSPGVPVVVMTGHEDERLAVEALHAGAQDCFARDSAGGAALRRALRFAIERSRAAAAAHSAAGQVEAALRESEARCRSLFEQSLDGILLTAPDGRILAANPAACQMLGYTEGELRRLGREGVVDAADPLLRAAVEERRRTGRFRGELTMVHRDGHRIPVDLSTRVFLDAEGQERTSMFVRDVTESKRAALRERLLAEAGRVLASPLDPDERMRRVARLAVPDLADWCVIVAPGEDGTLHPAAVAARDPARGEVLRDLTRLYPYGTGRGGRLVEEAMRAGEAMLLPEVSEEALVAAAQDERHLQLLRRLGPSTSMVVPLVAGDRTLGMVLLGSAEPGRRFDEEALALAGELARRAAMAVENARLYRRSKELRERAEQATRYRDEVLGLVAHDLRNPLGAIGMYAQLLDGTVLPDRDRKLVEGIASAAEQMDRLIQDLLEVSRIEAGRLVVEPEPVPAGELVAEALRGAEADAERRGIALAAEVADGSAGVLADRHRIRQVFGNLLGNALKFTPPGGAVTLRADARGGEVCFSVSDTGPGIAPGDLPHLFDRFFQARHARKGGAGLGLSIVKGFVEAHGGQVSVESSPGRGSTFRFTLPAVQLHDRAESRLHPVGRLETSPE